MLLKKAIITNFRGCCGPTAIHFHSFNCIVGQNDAGKSTILKALDIFMNETKPNRAELYAGAQQSQFSIELFFDCQNKPYHLGEQIPTTIENEEIINEENLLVIKKTWNVTDTNVSSPKMAIKRKKYEGDHDFLMKTEAQLMAQCAAHQIVTTKGNGEENNNVEKRQKLREFNAQNAVPFGFEYEDIPTTGTSKLRAIGEAIKKALPSFLYFKADTSLSDTDNAIQKYFKEMAYKIIEDEADTEAIENHVKGQLENVLSKITDKINDVVRTGEKVVPKVEFDWSKLITTSFVSTSTGNAIPLSSRGDGFRRITMMSYFEYLAENEKPATASSIIFGFEEPETFLHPSAQESLYEKLHSMADNGYQIICSTHSPTIVGNTKKQHIIHISRPDNNYTVNQTNIDYKELAKDLGIKPDHTFTPLFSPSRFLFLVEGPDDARAMHHMANEYKKAGLIPNTFEELSINIIPIGGCGNVKHWINLNLFTNLGKPYFIFLDSDKAHAAEVSANETKLNEYGMIKGKNFLVTKKRLLENYIHPTALQRLVPGAVITYSDFDHAKNFCKSYPDQIIQARLGGGKVAETHYSSLTFDELRMTWFDGTEDEFLSIYSIMTVQLN